MSKAFWDGLGSVLCVWPSTNYECYVPKVSATKQALERLHDSLEKKQSDVSSMVSADLQFYNDFLSNNSSTNDQSVDAKPFSYLDELAQLSPENIMLAGFHGTISYEVEAKLQEYLDRVPEEVREKNKKA